MTRTNATGSHSHRVSGKTTTESGCPAVYESWDVGTYTATGNVGMTEKRT